jgi:hypothetical protein
VDLRGPRLFTELEVYCLDNNGRTLEELFRLEVRAIRPVLSGPVVKLTLLVAVVRVAFSTFSERRCTTGNACCERRSRHAGCLSCAGVSLWEDHISKNCGKGHRDAKKIRVANALW